MNITIFGAGGQTGSRVVERALALGHAVTAVTRGRNDSASEPNLKRVAGDVLDAVSVAAALQNADAVICSIGPRDNFSPGRLMSEGATNLVAGCKATGCKRIIFQSGITLSDGKELSPFNRFAMRFFRKVYAKAGNDKELGEHIVRSSGLDWVIVRPAGMRAMSTTYRYTAGPKARISPLRPLSFADCADCLVRAAVEPDWVKTIVNVGLS